MTLDLRKENGQFKYLEKQSKKKDLYTGKYLTDEDTLLHAFILEHIYKNQRDTMQSNLVNSGGFRLVADKYAQYVGNPCWDRKYNFNKNVIDFAAIHKVIIQIERNDKGEDVWKHVNAEKHVNVNGDDYIFTVFEECDGDFISSDYTLIQRFYMEGETQWIENKLYKGIHTGLFASSPANLDDIAQTRGMLETVNTGYPRSLFVKEIKEESILEVIKSRVFQLDRLENVIDNELLSNVEKYTIINNINPKNVQSNEDILKSKTIMNVARGKDDAPMASVEYVKNDNALIKEAITYTSDRIREKLVAMTSIPTEFWGGNTGGSISTESRTLMYNDFETKIISIRDFFDEMIYEIYEVLGIEVTEETRHVWPEVIPKGKKELLDELKIAMDCKLTTHEHAIKRYMGITDKKELEIFIKKINLEYDNDKGGLDDPNEKKPNEDLTED